MSEENDAPVCFVTSTAARVMDRKVPEGYIPLREIGDVPDPKLRYLALKRLADHFPGITGELKNGAYRVRIKGEPKVQPDNYKTKNIASKLYDSHQIPVDQGSRLANVFGENAVGLCNHVANQGYQSLMIKNPNIMIEAFVDASTFYPEDPMSAVKEFASVGYSGLAKKVSENDR